jgi:class 3 adenylate cyclase/tetratricopeptide (TPR) repeat protein
VTSLDTSSAAARERKVVSVLFADLVGFTARSADADPEDVEAVQRPYHLRVRAEIERWGGRVEKYAGDAVMAVFGAPAAREDDAERAVRAALALPAVLRQVDVALAIRVAVNTGEVVVALDRRPELGEATVTGDAVNTASRLQSIAPQNGVVVGEVTYRATRDRIEYEELAPVELKGKPRPVRAWVARRALARAESEAERLRRAPFVGRGRELALLKGSYARVVRERARQAIVVSGEPGAGKSRLVAEFRSYLSSVPEPPVVRTGRCLPYGEGVTFWPLGEIVKEEAGIGASDDMAAADAKLTRLVGPLAGDDAERDWLKARLGPLVGAPAGAGDELVERADAFAAWRRLLALLAQRGPLVILWEDLHWADQAMLEFVESLADAELRVPLLVVCTARPELYEEHPDWGARRANVTRAPLSPLLPAETLQILVGLLGAAALPPETEARLLERAGGNPLYAVEFARMLHDRGLIEERDGEVRVGAGDVPVPETVHAVIAARLDSLAPGQKQTAQDAAVVGRTFWRGALAALGAGVMLDAALGELAMRELVHRVQTSSIEGDEEFTFHHALVCDVAYGGLPRGARAEKHAAVARWMERAGKRVDDRAELLAHHYGEALALARAARLPGAEQLVDPAVRYLELAGDGALSMDLRAAASHYRKALALLSEQDARRPALLRRTAVAARFDLRPEDARRDLEEAIEALRADGASIELGAALSDLAQLLQASGEGEDALSMHEEAEEILQREPPSRPLARAYVRRAGRLMFTDMHEAIALAEKALALAQTASFPEVAADAYGVRGRARCYLGDAGGVDDLRAGLDLSLELGLGTTTATRYVELATHVWLERGPAEGLELARQGLALCERCGFTEIAVSIRATGFVRFLADLGDWDGVMRIAEEVIASDLAGGRRRRLMADVHWAQALVLARRGRPGEAIPRAEEAVRLAREGPVASAPALAAAIAVHRAGGDQHAAVACAHELEERTRDSPIWLAWAQPEPVRALVEAGELDDAQRQIDESLPCDARRRNCLLSARAALAEARSELDDALALYDDAAAHWRAFGHAFEYGQAELGAARCLVTLGRVDQARLRLRAGRDVFVRLDARPSMETVDALLTKIR